MEINGKVVLVTGSAAGIGEATARKLAIDGWSVILHGQKAEIEVGEAIAADLRSLGHNAEFLVAQLEDAQQCAQLVEHAANKWGRLDALVNNAAAIVRSNLQTTDAELFDFVMNVNVRAPMLLIQAAYEHFLAAGGGRVVNIGSINGYCGEANQLAYSVSKGALMTLTRNLADSLGSQGIRVNQFNLGWVLTPNEYALKVKEGLGEGWPERLPRVYAPNGRLTTPEEVAEYVAYFISDKAGLVSGAIVDLEQYPLIGRNPVKET